MGPGPIPATEIVIGTAYVDGYRIAVTFADGATITVDLSGHLQGELFEPLRDTSLFRQVRFDPELGTVVWPNGADLAPEFLRHGPDRLDCSCSMHATARALSR